MKIRRTAAKTIAVTTAADRKACPLTAGMPANIRDNATPWEGGVGLHKALGASSAFVGVDNGGHYVYDAGSTCADKATVGFLTTGRLPGEDLHRTDVKQK